MRSIRPITLTAAALGLALTFTFGCLEDNATPVSNPVAGLPSSSGVAKAKAPVPKVAPCPKAATGGSFVSCGGQVYKTVKIGKQVWMAQNLNYDVPGTATDVCYGYKAENCVKYGRLYNWATAMALPLKCNGILSADDADCAIKTPYHQGICPAGWHIPSNERWNVIRNDDSKLKAKSGWPNYFDDPCESVHDGRIPGCNKQGVMRSSNGTDNYGFAALPSGGGFPYDGKLSFGNIGFSGYWWSASELGANTAVGRMIYHTYTGDESDGIDNDKNNLYSIRCLKD